MAKETVGEYLKRERELRQITLKEVSEGTKISVRRLRFIEENKFDDLPAEVFVRGFIKNYAEYIGLDPQEAILRLEEDFKEQGQQQTVQQEIPSTHFDIERKKRPYLQVAMLILILGIIFFGIYFFVFEEKKELNLGTSSSENNETLTIKPKEEKTPKILLQQEIYKEKNTGLSNNSTL